MRRLLFHPVIKTFTIASLLVYGLLYGGTWRGITSLRRDLLSASILAVLLCAWGIYKIRTRTPFHPTVLDRVMPLWGIAFAVSTLANLQKISLIGVGLGFVLLYVVLWYVINDLLSNGVLSAEMLTHSVLLAGIPIVVLSMIQLPSLRPYQRLYGVMDNPNTLGGFLLLLVPLLIYMVMKGRAKLRILYGFYLVAAILCLLGTDSRGALFGTLAALGIVGFMLDRSVFARVAFLCIAVPIGISLIGIRGDSGRQAIYHDAAIRFVEAPVTGNGLFTFRRDGYEMWRWGVTPGGVSLHAHNIALHIATELGLPGLLALATTMVVLLRNAETISHGLQLWTFAVLVGVFAHQLVDFPVMMPGLMLCVILMLTVTAYSPDYCKQRAKDNL